MVKIKQVETWPSIILQSSDQTSRASTIIFIHLHKPHTVYSTKFSTSWPTSPNMPQAYLHSLRSTFLRNPSSKVPKRLVALKQRSTTASCGERYRSKSMEPIIAVCPTGPGLLSTMMTFLSMAMVLSTQSVSRMATPTSSRSM